MRESLGRTLAWGAVLVTVGALAAPVSTACVGRECDSSVLAYGKGEMIGPTLWESNPVDGTWLPFPGNRTYVLQPHDANGNPIMLEAHTMRAYISPDPSPNSPVGANNWSEAIGNDAEWSADQAGQIVLTNITCANWYVRVELDFYDCDASPGCDAGPPASDAESDASADSATDASNEGAE